MNMTTTGGRRMSDLVERLQKCAEIDKEMFYGDGDIFKEAADEIERLQQRVDKLEAAILRHVEELGMIPDAETVQWWVENNQPVDILIY